MSHLKTLMNCNYYNVTIQFKYEFELNYLQLRYGGIKLTCFGDSTNDKYSFR